MTTISANRLFLFYTVCLAFIWIMVLAMPTSNLLPLQETLEEETKYTRNCKSLCDNCQCLGFYCGEECICECNNEQSDTECIAAMQTKARSQRMPFEILMQGPTANSFMRNALQFEQNLKQKNNKNSCHTKRSTVTIYKPSKDLKSLNNLQAMKVNGEKKSPTQRIKRSDNTQFEWFQDLSNTLVRPAPLGPRQKKTHDTETTTQAATKETSTQKMADISWFSDYTPHALTPRPLQRKKINENSEDSTASASTKSSRRNTMQAFRQDIASAFEHLSNSRDRDPDVGNHHGDNGDSEKQSFIANMFKGINDDSDNKLQLGTKASDEEQSQSREDTSFISKVWQRGKSNTFQGIDDNDDLENDFIQNRSNEEEESEEEQPLRREPQKQQHNTGRRKIYKNNAFKALNIPWLRRAADVADKSQEEQPQRKEQRKPDTATRRTFNNINVLPEIRIPWLRPNIFFFKNFKLS